MLEKIELLIAIIGGAIGIISVILIWRKKLLNTGFEVFKETYRREMNDFKDAMHDKYFDFQKDVRGYINANHTEDSKKFDTLIQLSTKTSQDVCSQANICRVIQAKRDGLTKADEQRLTKIENELASIKKNVDHITDVINHKKK